VEVSAVQGSMGISAKRRRGYRWKSCRGDYETEIRRNGQIKGGIMTSEMLDKIIAFEQGELNDSETLDLFQEMVNSGLVWELQGAYGRTAMIMIDNGWIKVPERMLQ